MTKKIKFNDKIFKYENKMFQYMSVNQDKKNNPFRN